MQSSPLLALHRQMAGGVAGGNSQRHQTANVVAAMMGGGGGGAPAVVSAISSSSSSSTPTTNKAKRPPRKKPSQRQARPVVMVLPGQFGQVHVPNMNDVLAGRGGRINGHAGNVQYRDMVAATKERYLDDKTKKLEKAHIAAEIVYAIRSMIPPGRFLTERGDGSWVEIGDARAFKKVGQALREDAPDIRGPTVTISSNAGDEYGDEYDDDFGDDDDDYEERRPSSSVKNNTSTKKGSGTSSRSTGGGGGNSVVKTPSPNSNKSTKTTPASKQQQQAYQYGPPPLGAITSFVTRSSQNSTPASAHSVRTASGSGSSTAPAKTITSKRGGRMGSISPSSSYHNQNPPVRPGDFDPDTMATIQTYYVPPTPPASTQTSSFKKTKISGAAAQTLHDFEMAPPSRCNNIIPSLPTTTAGAAADELFNRQFFPLPTTTTTMLNDAHSGHQQVPSSSQLLQQQHQLQSSNHNIERESSLMSGVSWQSLMSGVSQISGLTDPMSSISENARNSFVTATTYEELQQQAVVSQQLTTQQQRFLVQQQQQQKLQQQQAFQRHFPSKAGAAAAPAAAMPSSNHNNDDGLDDNMSWMTGLKSRSEQEPPPRRLHSPPPQQQRHYAPAAAQQPMYGSGGGASVASLSMAGGGGGDDMSQLSEQFSELYRDLDGSSLPSVSGLSVPPPPKTLWEV